jgi:dihydrofolate reductase
MRKVIYLMNVSLDGFIEGPNRELDWANINEALFRFFKDQQSEVDTLLYGRRLYEVMTYWETAEADPSISEVEREFARIWKNSAKIVFSKTLEQVQGNARLFRGDIAAEITKLKQQPGKDLEVGGPTLASTFMQLGLIDEYRLVVHPVVLGRGRPFFPALADKINLRLVETRPLGSGVVYLRYLIEKP